MFQRREQRSGYADLTFIHLAPTLCFTHHAACLHVDRYFHDFHDPFAKSFYLQISSLHFDNSSLKKKWHPSKIVVNLCFRPRFMHPWKVSVTPLSSVFPSAKYLVILYSAFNERTYEKYLAQDVSHILSITSKYFSIFSDPKRIIIIKKSNIHTLVFFHLPPCKSLSVVPTITLVDVCIFGLGQVGILCLVAVSF